MENRNDVAELPGGFIILIRSMLQMSNEILYWTFVRETIKER